MKKLALLFTFLGLFFSLTLQAQKKLPAFSFDDLAGKAFTNTSLKAGFPTIVFFYDPYCEHCNLQAEWIKESQAAFKNVQLLWVTTEQDMTPIQEFKKKHFEGTSLDKVYFLKDTKFRFDSYFGYTEAPGIFVYNKEGVFLKDFRKETMAYDLLKTLSGK